MNKIANPTTSSSVLGFFLPSDPQSPIPPYLPISRANVCLKPSLSIHPQAFFIQFQFEFELMDQQQQQFESYDYNGENKVKSLALSSKFPLTFWEVAGASGVFLGFAIGLLGVYLTLPDSDYSFLKLPRTLEDLHILRDNIEGYASNYTVQVLVGYCVVFIFMQTFMIPGTVFMSLLAGSLFGVLRGVTLVVFAATAGASSCYLLSRLIGRPLISSLWPDKLVFFQDQVAKRRDRLLNYMLFLRLTPTLPNMFINVASPIVNVPYHIFLLGTAIGLIPAAYVTVKAGITLGELQSVGDLYDIHSIGTLFLIGLASITPTLISKKNTS